MIRILKFLALVPFLVLAFLHLSAEGPHGYLLLFLFGHDSLHFSCSGSTLARNLEPTFGIRCPFNCTYKGLPLQLKINIGKLELKGEVRRKMNFTYVLGFVVLRDVVKVFPVSSPSFARKTTRKNRARSHSVAISFHRRVWFTVRSWRPSETLSHSFTRTLSEL